MLAAALVWLVVFVLITALISRLYIPDYQPVDASRLPEDFPLAVSWEHDGATHCRAVWHRQLQQLRRSVPTVTLHISDKALARCQQAITQLREQKQWPQRFDWESRLQWPIAVISLKDGWYEIDYSRDDDRVNQGRYRVVDGAIIEPQHRSYHGPASVLNAMPYGLGFTLLLILARRLIWRHRRKAKAEN